MSRANVASQEPRRHQAWRSAGCASDGARVYDGSSGSRVEEHVVVGWVIRNSVAAADHGLLAGHTEEMRLPCETDGGTEILVVIWNRWHGRHISRSRSTPEWRGASLVGNCNF